MIGSLSSLKRWAPPSALVVALLVGVAAAQRIGVPWQSWMAGLLCLAGLLLTCITVVMTLNVLMRLSFNCYQEWFHGSHRGPTATWSRVLEMLRRPPKSIPDPQETDQTPPPAQTSWPHDKFSSHVG
jgi:hypothetical protein